MNGAHLGAVAVAVAVGGVGLAGGIPKPCSSQHHDLRAPPLLSLAQRPSEDKKKLKRSGALANLRCTHPPPPILPWRHHRQSTY